MSTKRSTKTSTKKDKQENITSKHFGTIDDEINNLRSSLGVELTQDVFDDIEARADTLKETQDLTTKVKLHKELEMTMQKLESELNSVAGMMDTLDEETTSEAVREAYDKEPEKDEDNLLNLDILKTKIENEEVLQLKLLYLQKLIKRVELCKANCKRKLTLNTVS